MLADSVIAGLSSTENFSDAKSSLRQVTETQPPPLTESQRQLLPYKSIMLLHVKGRRQVQVRLVAPSADSMNSGDCFVLVTADAVFAWFGALANVVEINKARELADWIHKHHELNYRGTGSPGQTPSALETSYISVYEQLQDDEDLTTMDIVEAGLVKTRYDQVDPAAIKFWEALGYDSSRSVHPHGLPEEDELYESLIQHTNRVYEVTTDQLVPCVAHWGTILRKSMLRSDKAFVFDFGSEVYLWTGTQVSPEVRLAGIELVQQAYSAPYDYSECRLSPLNPMSTHPNIPVNGTSRPDWTLVGKVTGKGETVLFKEKFVDWSDISRLKLQPASSLRLNRDKSLDNKAYTVIQPYSADQLFDSAFVDTPPPPRLLTLEGRFVGRGGEGCRYEDGIMRRFSVQSGPLRMWHVSEFNRTEMTESSHGQFHQCDTYVIRWPFKVIYVGLRDIPSRANDASREQCVYFFWHGSQSKVTEKGASAVMTIELDEERCPQIRVTEGKEPPAFCRLFNGRMIIHSGHRLASTPSSPTTSPTSPRVRLFLVLGEAPAEGYLLEVPAQLSSLRSQGALLALQYTNGNGSSDNAGLAVQKAWMWYGMYASETTINVARHIVERLKQSCPFELASDLRHVIEFTQTEEKLGPGEMVFLLNAEDRVAAPLCLQSNPTQGQLVAWHLTAHSGSTIQSRRLSYTLQPDPSMLAGVTNGKLPLSDRTQQQGDHQRESNPLAIAKAVAERLRASNDAANAQLKQSVAQSGFPILLSELYAANQPALFLLLDGRQAVYLWQGWWPLKRRSRDLSGSQILRSPTRSRSSAQSVLSSSSSVADESPGFLGSDYERCEVGSVVSDQPVETLSPGSARSRFYALRLAALKTAKALAAKLGVRASVVYAGVEPNEFLALFPPHIRLPEVTANYHHEECKSDGQIDDVNDLLATNKPGTCTLYDLQQRPLPPDMDATCLEAYLDDNSFQNAFGMNKEEFEQLPKWKKAELKKNLGLF
ncbi:Supervillin [Fasciolopsis buskii]|uniref:Supervillin n=1 Tax=Fasciolopsis buskii TaxID=27845 RepID=A0A8E0VH97_9TREM|nr:Supervillin [Fasciolopsis buski]